MPARCGLRAERTSGRTSPQQTLAARRSSALAAPRAAPFSSPPPPMAALDGSEVSLARVGIQLSQGELISLVRQLRERLEKRLDPETTELWGAKLLGDSATATHVLAKCVGPNQGKRTDSFSWCVLHLFAAGSTTRDHCGCTQLRRFVRARDANLEEAEAMVMATLEWRAKYGTDSILDDHGIPEILTKTAYIAVRGQPAPARRGDGGVWLPLLRQYRL